MVEHVKLANSIDDVAHRVGICRDGVYDLICQHKLEARKIGRRTVVTEEALLKFMAQLPTLKLPG
jgi:excisionase family DNA binding protein